MFGGFLLPASEEEQGCWEIPTKQSVGDKFNLEPGQGNQYLSKRNMGRLFPAWISISFNS